MILTENLTRTYDDKVAVSERACIRFKVGLRTCHVSTASPRHNKQTAR